MKETVPTRVDLNVLKAEAEACREKCCPKEIVEVPVELPIGVHGTPSLAPNFTDLPGILRGVQFAMSPQMNPPGAPFAWVNVNTGGLFDKTTVPVTSPSPVGTPYYANPAIAGGKGITVVDAAAMGTSPLGADGAHLTVAEAGVYILSVSGRVCMLPTGFAISDVSLGLSFTPPGGTVAAPVLDGIASASIYGWLIPSGIAGSVSAVITAPGTRIDVWIRATAATVAIGTTYQLDQNTLFGITRIGPKPE
jgi:hypothetical protein